MRNNADRKKSKKHLKSSEKIFKKSSFSKGKSAIAPFLTATFTAMIIGVLLGLMMLNMFTNKDSFVSTSDQESLDTTNNVEMREDAERTLITTLKQLDAYVIQLGVFSEQKNADAWSETYEQIGFPSTHFHRDDQYYLFTGMAATEEKAKEFAEPLLKEGMDVYVKEWVTNEIEIYLTEEEDKWFGQFYKQWNESVQLLEKEEKIILNGWTKLTQDYPSDSEEITHLVQVIQLLPENEMENNFELQNHLLNIWKVYDELFNTD